MTNQKLSHYIVAWGSTAGSQVLNYKGPKAALRDARKFDRECPKDAPHRVFAVYVKEIAR